MTSVRMRTLAQLFILITITWSSLFRKQWLTNHHTYHYWVSHSSVLANFLPRSHSSIWENYGNYEKLARTEEGWCHAIHFRFCGSGLISSLFYCLLSPSPLSKPHQFLCKHNTFVILSQPGQSQFNKWFEVSNQRSKWPSLTWLDSPFSLSIVWQKVLLSSPGPNPESSLVHRRSPLSF